MEEIAVRGIILSAAAQGEDGRRLSILTDRLGRITAFASGAAKAKSHLIGKLRPFTAAAFTLIRGKSAYRVRGVELMHAFEGIPLDPDIYFYGAYVLETAEYFSREGMDERDAVTLLNLIYLTLDKLESLPPDSNPRETLERPEVGVCSSATLTRPPAMSPQSTPTPRAPMPNKFDLFAENASLRQTSSTCLEKSQTSSTCLPGGDSMPRDLIRAIYELRLLVIQGEYSEEPQYPKAAGLWTYVLTAPLKTLYDLGAAPPFAADEAAAFIASADELFSREVPHSFKTLKILREAAK